MTSDFLSGRILCILLLIALVGCNKPQEGELYVYQDGEYVWIDRSSIVYEDNGLFRDKVHRERYIGFQQGYKMGLLAGKEMAAPAWWIPEDGVFEVLFGGGSLMGVSLVIIGLTIVGFKLVLHDEDTHARILYGGTILFSALFMYIIARVTAIDAAISNLVYKPTPISSKYIMFVIALSAIASFSLAKTVRFAVNNMSWLRINIIFCFLYGLVGAIVFIFMQNAWGLEQPMGNQFAVLSLGVSFGLAAFALWELFRYKEKNQKSR